MLRTKLCTGGEVSIRNFFSFYEKILIVADGFCINDKFHLLHLLKKKKFGNATNLTSKHIKTTDYPADKAKRAGQKPLPILTFWVIPIFIPKNQIFLETATMTKCHCGACFLEYKDNSLGMWVRQEASMDTIVRMSLEITNMSLFSKLIMVVNNFYSVNPELQRPNLEPKKSILK